MADETEFRCNICGDRASAVLEELDREQPSCASCGSTLRQRTIVHALALELFAEDLALPDFPVAPSLRGIGLSDWDRYADVLAQRLDYRNTYYHQEPRLDIMAEPPEKYRGCDFVTSSDVFEHVPPPVSRAFVNSRRLLKTGGLLVVSVPYVIELEPREHYPSLWDYEVVSVGGLRRLRNTTQQGTVEWFDELVFHGGEGETLELRLFSESWLRRELEEAGFGEIRVRDETCREHGVVWPVTWSIPWTARAI